MNEYSNSTKCLTLPGDTFDRKERRKAAKTFSKLNGSLAIYLIVASIVLVAVSVVAAIALGEEKYVELANTAYFNWALQIISMYIVAFPLFLILVRKLPKATREKSTISFKEFCYIFLVSEAIMLSGSLFSEWFVSTFKVKMGFQTANATSNLILNTPVWLIILVVVIIGPIVEELIFRKALIDRMSIYGDRSAVIMSALAFGFFHGNFHQLFYATVLGIVLGYVYTRTRRCGYTILLHMAVNFMGSVPAVLVQNSINRIAELPENAEITGQVLSDILSVYAVAFVQYGLALAGIVVFVVATFKRAYHFSGEYDIKVPFFSRLRVYILNLGTILFFAFMIWTCITSLTTG